MERFPYYRDNKQVLVTRVRGTGTRGRVTGTRDKGTGNRDKGQRRIRCTGTVTETAGLTKPRGCDCTSATDKDRKGTERY